MKVSELEGAELDYWVAKALGLPVEMLTPGEAKIPREPKPGGHWYEFSSKWEQGGPIIEREGICLVANATRWPKTEVHGWRAGLDIEAHEGHSYSEHTSDMAYIEMRNEYNGKTSLIAAMRCFVASKFGETVESAVTKAPDK